MRCGVLLDPVRHAPRLGGVRSVKLRQRETGGTETGSFEFDPASGAAKAAASPRMTGGSTKHASASQSVAAASCSESVLMRGHRAGLMLDACRIGGGEALWHFYLLRTGTTTHAEGPDHSCRRTSAGSVSMYSASDSASGAISIPCASLLPEGTPAARSNGILAVRGYRAGIS